MAKIGKRKRTKGQTFCLALFLIVVLFVGGTVAINVYTVESTRHEVHTIAQIKESEKRADAILVLGASVFSDGTPSDILADRLEVAVDLYKSGAAKRIIVSGDNQTSHYNESDAMQAYCMRLGVPKDAIEVDPQGVDTYASVYRAKFVYGADSLMIVTQAYHLYRALMIANLLGVKPADGVAADKGAYANQRQYSLRDYLARDKDFFRAAFRLHP